MWESLSSNVFTVSITWNACLAHDGTRYNFYTSISQVK